MSIKLHLPFKPFSQNDFWYKSKRITTEGRKWREDIQGFIKNKIDKSEIASFGKSPLFVSYKFYSNDGRFGDTFNYEKVFTDSLQGYLFENDKQIIDGRVGKSVDKQNTPHIEMEIHEYQPSVTILGTPEQLAEVSKHAKKLNLIIV